MSRMRSVDAWAKLAGYVCLTVLAALAFYQSWVVNAEISASRAESRQADELDAQCNAVRDAVTVAKVAVDVAEARWIMALSDPDGLLVVARSDLERRIAEYDAQAELLVDAGPDCQR